MYYYKITQKTIRYKMNTSCPPYLREISCMTMQCVCALCVLCWIYSVNAFRGVIDGRCQCEEEVIEREPFEGYHADS